MPATAHLGEMKKLLLVLLKDHGQMSRLMDPLANIRCPLEYSFNHSVLSSSVNDVDDDLILQYYTVN